MVSSPRPPDPYATANAQSNANMTSAQQNAIMGNVNERNPYGSVNYNNLGYEPVYDNKGNVTYAPRYERVTQLSPDQMKLLGLQTQTQYNLGQTGVQQSAKVGNLLNTNLTTAGMQPWNAGPQGTEAEFSKDRGRVEQALMDRWRSQNEPAMKAEQTALVNRGLNPGAQGWGSAQDAQARARTDATNAAIAAGGQEQTRMFQMAGTAADRGNALRGQQLSEATQLRNQPINEISALMSGSQVTNPQFQAYNAPNVATTPIGQYIYDNYNARAQNAQATNQGLFGLAGVGARIGANMAFPGAGMFG